jgi:integrase
MITNKRARRGTGSVRQREDGRWEARLWVRGPGGIQRQQSIRGATRAEVESRLHSVIVKRDAGTLAVSAGRGVTLGGFLGEWITGVEPTLRPRTAIGYRQAIRDHLTPALGRIALVRLRPEQVQALHAAMLTSGLSPKTIANSHGVLHAALEQAVRWRLIPTNVAGLVRPPRRSRPEMHVLSPEQVHALLEAADKTQDPHAVLWALALGTGLRQGELLGLSWPDADLEHGVLHVRRSLTHLPAGDVLAEPKSSSSRRSVRLGPTLVDRLARHRAAAAETALREGRSYDLTGPVFRRSDGRPLSASIVLKAWHRALVRAGLPLVRFHDARHSVATTLLARGMSARVVADVLGHANVSTTLAVYAHTTAGQHEQAAAILGEALG